MGETKEQGRDADMGGSVHERPDSLPTALHDVAAVCRRQVAASSPRGRGRVNVPLTGAEAGHSLGQALGSRAPVGRSAAGSPSQAPTPGRGHRPQAHKPGSGCLLSILPV